MKNMSTIKDYLEIYGLHTFAEEPWNEVDNVLFSIFAYLPLEEIWKERQYSIVQLVDLLATVPQKKYTGLVKNSLEYLQTARKSERYQNLWFSNFISEHSADGQFSAVTIHFDEAIYVSYRGTDQTLVGWRENFAMSYQFPVFAQEKAIEYLNHVEYKGRIYVGGHSKGGNLAMSAAMFAIPSIWKQIQFVYNNDGPGFKKEQQESKDFGRLETKLQVLVPEESVVGMLLYGSAKMHVIRARTHGLNQHNPAHWHCYGAHFIPSTLSEISQKIKEKSHLFFERMNEEQRKRGVETFFEIIRSTGVKSLKELRTISFSHISELIHSTKELDEETKLLFLEVMKLLLTVPKEAVIIKIPSKKTSIFESKNM